VGSTGVDGLNLGYASDLLEDYLLDPASVAPEWRALFENGGLETLVAVPGLRRLLDGVGGAPAATAVAGGIDEALLGAVAAATALVRAIRTHGHLAARLDPLGSQPPGDPALQPEYFDSGLDAERQQRVPASMLRVFVPGANLRELLPHLRDTYCGTLAYQIEHISSHEQRVWLHQAIESGRFRGGLDGEARRGLLRRLSQVEAFERYLRRAFVGQKQFSIEGLDVMVPMLDAALDLAAADGAREVIIGMAHRGRLSVLAHTLGVSYRSILLEFEGERTLKAVTHDPEGGSGDVKYHLGAGGERRTAHGDLRLTLVPNPSHLEAVDPVVEGAVRAAQTDRSRGAGSHDPSAALAILIHGDASFPAQGVVAETFNLQALDGYSTGGTLHLIANNQIGFTTDPHEGRSTHHSSDLAMGFNAPVIHVNADDPEAAVAAIRLAMAFRSEFRRDVVVDLVGYRRFGHNEQDEPAFTQPLMAAAIERHPTVRELYAGTLRDEGVLTEAAAESFVADTREALRQAHAELRSVLEKDEPVFPAERTRYESTEQVVTSVPAERLRALNDELLATPEGFGVHPKLMRMLERRREALAPGRESEALIDWGQAESLAFASLLCGGTPVRLCGQDSERGTFSHRHLVLHDVRTGERLTMMQRLSQARASFEVHNSPLSELAVLGFETGYASRARDALVLWEAQFGDFVNGAQVLVDQFIVSGYSKWGETSHLTLLLPHGYEGNGPEHSSARLERFLQLSAEENIRIANCTTAAQYFHLLRRQALFSPPRPLVVMTPKSLLRLPQAFSSLAELSGGQFRRVLDDPEVDDKAAVRRLVICSGKLYYDLAGHERRRGAETIALARIELLYPFPVADLVSLIGGFPALEEIVWAQEEPQNMGAWRAIRHRLEQARPNGVALRYVGRPWRASPSEGYPTAHLREQERIVREALQGAPGAGSP
jgi:2-oxoglutarate dehydrogenase E1 component